MNNLFLVKEIFTDGYIATILNIISLFAVLCSVMVIISKNPVVSVLFLIGLFAGISCYLILIGLGFMGLAYLVVYIGAIIIGIIKPLWFNLVALVQIQLYSVASSLLIFIQIFQIVVYSNFASYDLYSNNYRKINRVYGPGFLLYNPRSNIVKLSSKQLIYNGKTCFSTLSNQEEIGSLVPSDNEVYNDENFLNWFVGFSDGESNFSIVFYKDSNGNIISATLRFTIELHVDDIEVLKFIKSKLNIGTNIAVYGNSCKFTVVHRKDIYKLILIFDKYNLNTTKYLDYLDFKQAYNLYKENKSKDKTILIDQLLKLKNGMNNNRTNFNLPSNHKIVITDFWLLGFIEGEGSFYLERKELRVNFSIGLAQIQLPVLDKIKEFLEMNLPFDKYSMFKLKNSSCISISVSTSARENSKPFVRLIIRNTNVLTNYLIPYLNNLKFLSKKAKDFEDFKIICTSLYNGTYRNEDIKSLIIKLSYTMNNFRLSTNSDLKKINDFSDDDYFKLINAKPTIIHLNDGRQVDSISKKEVNIRWTNCVYEIVNDLGEITLASTLNEAANNLNVDFRTVKRQLDSKLYSEEGFSVINGKKVRRIAVFYPDIS